MIARTYMQMSRRGDLNAPSIEYFLVKADDGGMPGSDASVDLTTEIARARLPYTVNLPSDNMCGHGYDHTIAEIIYV